MIVSPEILRKEMIGLLTQIDDQMKEVRETAVKLGAKPEQIRDAQGNWAMSPLLLAKVQAIHTLAMLNEPRIGRKSA